MKKWISTISVYCILMCIPVKVAAYMIPGLPTEVSSVDWTKLESFSNVHISSDFVIELDYDWTPDEYYWKIYRLLRSCGYTDRISKDVSSERKAEYTASYYAKKPFCEKTVQFYVYGSLKGDNKYEIDLISCDVSNNRYRVIAMYSFERKDNGSVKIIRKDELKGNWKNIDEFSIVAESLKYYWTQGKEAK